MCRVFEDAEWIGWFELTLSHRRTFGEKNENQLGKAESKRRFERTLATRNH
jgi:hypothetical protein